MKNLIIILLAVFALSACQQEAEKAKTETREAAQTVAEKAKKEAEKVVDSTKAAVSGEHNNQVEAAPLEPYTEVEPQFECEQPVVLEFFAYQCPHCYNLEPSAAAWRKKNAGKVKFVSVPSHLGRSEFGPFLLVHHAAEKLGILESTQHALFKRLHEEKKVFSSPEEAADFLVAQGANRKKALELLNDQESMGKIFERDFNMMQKYKVTSVPRVIVNHQYSTSITQAGGHDEVFQLVDELLKKDHNCKPKSSN